MQSLVPILVSASADDLPGLKFSLQLSPSLSQATEWTKMVYEERIPIVVAGVTGDAGVP